MSFLKRQGYPLEGTNVSYYSAIFSAFVNCNMDPVGDFVHICEKDLEMIDNAPSLRLRFEKGINQLYHDDEESDSERDDDADEEVLSASQGGGRALGAPQNSYEKASVASIKQQALLRANQ